MRPWLMSRGAMSLCAVRRRIVHRCAVPLALAWLAAACASGARADNIDVLRFGDPVSEQAHQLKAESSATGSGALGQPFRVFQPLARDDWRGGSASFRLNVRGDRQNYLSVRLWGGDVNANQGTLYCEGRQLGYRHASDHDILDQGTKYPVAPGRFHYVTHTLPRALTDGRVAIDCRLRVTGPIWRYGSEFATFQKPMTQPSRGFYALMVHEQAMVGLDAVEGRAPASPVAPELPPGTLDKVASRIDGQVAKLWAQARPANQLEISFMGKTYVTRWSKGYRAAGNRRVIVAGIDGMWEAYKKDARIAYYDKATPNEGWFGFGLIGEALKHTAADLQAELDGQLKDVDGSALTRRQALERMFADSRKWNKEHRRLYTNQSMIKDLFGIWYNNEGLIAIGSKLADPRSKLLPFFYESVGLQPWTGSVNERGEPTYAAAEADARFSVPRNYYETTRKGLTKELGYVGGYGEVLDWVSAIYEATRPSPGEPGDAQIRGQLVKIARARAYFRYPHWDEGGHRAMRLEAATGWRDVYFPSDIMYAQKPSWDSSPLQAALATRDPALLGYAQQMINDRQLLPSIEHMLQAPGLRATIGLVDVIDEVRAMKALPAQAHRLPMSPGAPDFVFADEEDGVVAIKHGDEILYASLYWRANYGISGLARVHHVTPVTDRTATVVLDRQEFEPSGLYFTRPDNPHINGTRFTITYPEAGSVWTAGERQAVARLPDGSRYVPGEDNGYAGRADFYQLSYGPYLIAMNSSEGKRFSLALPPRAGPVRELVSGSTVEPTTQSLVLPPGSTAVIYLGER